MPDPEPSDHTAHCFIDRDSRHNELWCGTPFQNDWTFQSFAHVHANTRSGGRILLCTACALAIQLAAKTAAAGGGEGRKLQMACKTHRLDTVLDGNESTVLTILAEDIGLVGTVQLRHKKKIQATISSLYVADLARNQGAGSHLLRECEAIASESGCKTISLAVSLTNTEQLSDFYERRGYLPVFEFTDGDLLFTKLL
jgi:GNAT superfamily N-acetyltransferase